MGTPVRRIEHPPTVTECSCCSSELVKIRDEETKILNYIPASFELEVHVRPVMGCNRCKESSPVTTKLPAGLQLIERSPVGVGLPLRPIAIGRKNWLFAGSHEGAMRAAMFYSLINSCRLNKVNTWKYFNDILPKIQVTSNDQMHLLLPNVWATQNRA